MRGNDEGRLANLSDLQRQIVQIVWANAPVTAETVREKLSRPLKESTVRTVLWAMVLCDLLLTQSVLQEACVHRGLSKGANSN